MSLPPSAMQDDQPSPPGFQGVPALDMTGSTTGNSTTMSVRLAALDRKMCGGDNESPDLLPIDDDDDDEGGGAGLKLCLSETAYDQTGSLTTTGGGLGRTRGGSTKPFNPHVTMGGTVHAGRGLAVGAGGVQGKGKSFMLDPNDFAPLLPAATAATPAAKDAEPNPLADAGAGDTDDALGGRQGSDDSVGSTSPPDVAATQSVLLGRGASGSVRLMVHIPTGAAVAVKTIATDERRHFDSILSEVGALMDAKQLFAEALGATGSAPALSAPATGGLHDSDSSLTGQHAPGSSDGEAKDRNEAVAKKGLRSPRKEAAPQTGFIVDFLGAWSKDGNVHIAMECMAGSLTDLGRVPEPIAAKMGLMLFTGLHVLHRHLGLLHRDIKSTNVLFDGSGVVKLADFGVSSKLDPAKLEQTKTFVGSVMYMSPERVLGEAYSYPSDVWAMALTIAEVVSGQHPFKPFLGEEAFRGGHEGRFWKLCDFFTLARKFEKLQKAADELAAVEGKTDDDQQDAARAAAELRAFASENGVKLDDARLPKSAGFVARACAVDADLSADLLQFLAACLRFEPHTRPKAVDVLGCSFVARHHRDGASGTELGSAQADMDDVRAWLNTSVPKLCETQSTREAAAATAKRVRERASKKTEDVETVEVPPAPVKKSSVRARLTNLASEPPAESIYADNEQAGVQGGCCMMFGARAKPAATKAETAPAAPAAPEDPAAAKKREKEKKKAKKKKDDSGCIVA